MKTWLIGVFSFVIKEFHEVRRQPSLLISLIGGPFLVLALFGAAFSSPNPRLRTILVWPEGGVPGISRNQVEYVINLNSDLVDVMSDEEEALQMLANGKVEVVQVVPKDILQQRTGGGRPEFKMLSYTIDPNIELWLQSLIYYQTSYINRQILLEQTREAQTQAESIQSDMTDAKDVLSGLEDSLSALRERRALEAVGELRSLLTSLKVILPYLEAQQGQEAPQSLKDEIDSLLNDLNMLDETLRSGRLVEQSGQIDEVVGKIDNLQESVDIFTTLPANTIVFPLQGDYTNLRGEAYSTMIFYAPGVLALLIQHLAVSLGAMTLVRERQRGAFEVFRVAPLDIPQIMLGKTLANSLYVLLAGAALMLLLRLLNVPFLGPLPLIIALMLLLTLASVGIGLLISAISKSDSQAIQLTMILLLFSIFFSGFFLPLNSFKEMAQPINALLPMSHGLTGLQAMMLVGRTPDPRVWYNLAIITLVVFGALYLVLHRIFTK